MHASPFCTVAIPIAANAAAIPANAQQNFKQGESVRTCIDAADSEITVQSELANRSPCRPAQIATHY